MGFNIITQNIEQYADLASFPATGESNILYIAEDTDTAYYWDSLAYASVTGAGGGGSFTGLMTLDDSGHIGPISTGSDIDNLVHANLETGNYLLINPSSDIEITGILAPAAGINQMLFFSNTSNSKKVKFKNNNSSSSSANRFLLKGDITVEKNMGLILIYDHVANRWRCVTKQN